MLKRSIFVLAILLTACSGTDGAPVIPDGPAVFLRDIAYDPVEITVTEGETVTWVWDDSGTAHDVVGEGFRSELLTGGSFSHTFEEPGTYPYLCSIHPTMTGTVIVEASS